MKVYWLFCFFCITSLLSCEKSREHKVTKYEDGTIKSEIDFINDTVMDGIAKFYYENGELKDEIEFENGERDGLHRVFDSAGRKVTQISFKNGLQQGATIEYFPNGIIQSKSQWIKGKQYSGSYYFYPDGKIKTYRCRDFDGNIIYLLDFDKEGNLMREDGYVFSPKFEVNWDTITLNEELVVSIAVSEPPSYISKIWIAEDGANKKEYPIKNSIVSYKKRLTNPGLFTFSVIGELRDSSQVLLLKDSVSKEIFVKE